MEKESVAIGFQRQTCLLEVGNEYMQLYIVLNITLINLLSAHCGCKWYALSPF